MKDHTRKIKSIDDIAGIETKEQAIDYLNQHTNIKVSYVLKTKSHNSILIETEKELIAYARYEKLMFGKVK